MKVVLIETMGNLGLVGDVVNVRPGYARNFLLPQQKAVLADSQAIKQVAHRAKILEHKIKKAAAEAQLSKTALENETIIIRKMAGENDKLFGSVTSMDIEKGMKEKGYSVARKHIRLEQPIKKTGSYEVQVKLCEGVEVQLSINVVAQKVQTEE